VKKPPLLVWGCGAAVGMADGALAGGLVWGAPGILAGVLWGSVLGAVWVSLAFTIRLRRRSRRASLIATIIAETIGAAYLAIFVANIPPRALVFMFLDVILLSIGLGALFFAVLASGFALGTWLVLCVLRSAIAWREPKAAALGTLYGALSGETAVAIAYIVLKHDDMPDSAGLAVAFALAAATSLAVTGALIAAEMSAWRRRRAARRMPPDQALTDGG